MKNWDLHGDHKFFGLAGRSLLSQKNQQVTKVVTDTPHVETTVAELRHNHRIVDEHSNKNQWYSSWNVWR